MNPEHVDPRSPGGSRRGLVAQPLRPWAIGCFFGTIGVGMAVILGMSLLTPDYGGRDPDRRTYCKNYLKQIGLALHNYHDEFGCLPPAYVADAQGKPLYSWRVLLLPYLEQNNLYRAFKLNESWDSPDNIKFSSMDLPELHCASDLKARPGRTSYVAITGPGTAFEGAKSHTFRDFKDGMSNTLLVVEVADSDIHWAEPRDLNIDAMNLTINADPHGFSSHHKGGAQALFADGSARMLSNELPKETVRALLTINGGESPRDF